MVDGLCVFVNVHIIIIIIIPEWKFCMCIKGVF